MRILKTVVLVFGVAVIGVRDIEAARRPARAPMAEPAGIALVGVGLLAGAHAVRKRLTPRG